MNKLKTKPNCYLKQFFEKKINYKKHVVASGAPDGSPQGYGMELPWPDLTMAPTSWSDLATAAMARMH